MAKASARVVVALATILSAATMTQFARGQEKKPTIAADWPKKILLWEHGAPGALGTEETDQPAIYYFAPWGENPSGTAVIVAPGGSYMFLAANHEGRQVANWLNALGVVAFVLTYRVGPKYRHPIEIGDAQRAIRMVRARAQEFHVSPNRIGIFGFSAGGHLASTAETHFDNGKGDATDPVDRVSSRPDFAILGYPVISMSAAYRHEGSTKNLLGENPDKKLEEGLSNELQVTQETPPTFLFTTSDDDVVPAENSVAFYLALRKAGVPAELHAFEKGPHGVGLDLGDALLGEWPKLLTNWMRSRGLLTKPAR